MRRFALLTGTIVLGLAALAAVLPGTDRYVSGVDDGPPQRFKTIADAELAAGFDFPDAGTPPGWQIEDVSVIPAFFVRRLLAENRDLALRPLPNQDKTRYLWGNVADPPPDVRNFVSVAYISDKDVLIALNINFPISNHAPFRPIAGARLKSRENVRIGGRPAMLVSYESELGDAMVVEWRVDHVPVRATAYNLTPNPLFHMTPDEFVSFLANVR